jgi:hypothetical protein
MFTVLLLSTGLGTDHIENTSSVVGIVAQPSNGLFTKNMSSQLVYKLVA